MKYILIILIFSIKLLANIGSITLIKGQATLLRGNTTIEVKMGSKVHLNDKIDTYKKSKLQIRLNDNTILTLGQNTEYIIDSYDDQRNPNLHMTLINGLLTTISGKIGKLAPHKFILKTKTTVIGIRGTKWKTFVGEKSENSVCYEGTITIKLAKQQFDLPAGYMFLIKDGKTRKFKTNLHFFDSLIKKAQLKQSIKPLPKITLPKNIPTNNIEIKNSTISTNVKVDNVNVSKDASANIGNIQNN